MTRNLALAQDSYGYASRCAQRVMHLLLEMSNLEGPEDGPPRAELVSPVHHQKVRAAVAARSPIRLILPAFPAKSGNREKTISNMPDLGELLALRRLNKLCSDIQAFYPPGAQVVICSDGRVFSDLVGITESDVEVYAVELREIARRQHMASLEFFDLDDAMPHLRHDEMRAELVARFGDSVDQVRRQVLENPFARLLFGGIHRFIFEDRLAMEPGRSRNKVRNESKEITYNVIQRSNAWSRFLQERFPEAVRLSIHPQRPEASKLGIQMVAGDSRWATPWHNVTMSTPRGWKLVRRADAVAAGAQLKLVDGRYAYYGSHGDPAHCG